MVCAPVFGGMSELTDFDEGRILANLPPHPEAKDMEGVRNIALLSLHQLGDIPAKHKHYFENRFKKQPIHTDVTELTKLADIASLILPYVNTLRSPRDPSRSPSIYATRLAQLMAPFLFIGAEDDDFTLRRVAAFVTLSAKLAGKVVGEVPASVVPNGQEAAYSVIPMMPMCMLLAFRLLCMAEEPGCRVVCVTKERNYLCCFPNNTFDDEKGEVAGAFRDLLSDYLLASPFQGVSVDWYIARVLTAADLEPQYIHFREPEPDIIDDAPLFDVAPLQRAKRARQQENNSAASNKRPCVAAAAPQPEEPVEAVRPPPPMPPPQPEANRQLAVIPAAPRVVAALPSLPVNRPISTDEGIMVGAACAAYQTIRAMYFGSLTN